ncbi:MAG: GEVED domain-containing protein [Bacteroidales bacterium]|nr:GEVED domain-containing protein [Bacteroidales bacterium]
MKTKTFITTLSLLAVLLFPFTVSYSQQTFTKVITPVGFDKSQKLTDVDVVAPAYRDRSWKENVIPNKDDFLEEFNQPATWTGKDPVLQDYISANRSTASIGQNFAGVPNLNGVAPPDTDGDVGPNHYMQMVNLSFQIFDKSGNSLYGPADNITLWDGFNGPWSGTNDGDPIVLYDEYADRWIASQFSLPYYPGGPFYELIAVSETGDPTGAWYRYAYEFTNMPDYPKFGVWPDGYYFTINQFKANSFQYAGGGVCVADRNAMINGDPNAQMIVFNLGTSYGSLLPADADGTTQPAAGSPNYLANLGSNSLRIWEASINWANPSSSTISLINTLSVQPYSYSGISINQPGTSQTLDNLASRLMYRLQYRNFGTYEVLLTNHTVNANGSGQAGVRWYELRNNGSGWSVYQQGTFAPADADHRWMGSIAMNGNGDIGLGYSVSGSSTYPSIRFAGQTAANSGTGVLDIVETSIVEGSMSQTGVNRWGDYSMMSVDPVNDQTFWYTTEYSDGGWSWLTQIASFTFAPPIVEPPIANFEANPNPAMQGMDVSFTDLSTNNPGSWNWSFPGGTPSVSTEQNPQVTYATPGIYDVSLEVSNSAGSDSELKTGYMNITEYTAVYCESSGSSTASEWIESLSIGSFTNQSGNNGGYADYTNMQVSVEAGQTYNLNLLPGYAVRPNREFWRLWIDFNQDSDFTDNGELVFSADGMRNGVSGTITIPSGLSGETRMRVSMKYNASQTSCEQFAAGEVEDYTIVIGTAVPLAPVADFSGTPTSVTVGNSVQFTDLSLNDPTSWNWSFTGGTPASSTDQNPLVTYDLVGNYQVSLTVTNDQGSDTKTVADFITVTEGSTSSYCESQSSSNALDWIAGVGIGSFSNPSSASLYSDFTGLIIGLTPGSSNTIILTPGFSGKSQREFWRIWIDFNGDGDFEDTDEEVFIANNQKDVVNGLLSIPSYASGQTRMRVTMKNGGSPIPCEVFDYGEVEDYTVDFGNVPLVFEKLKEFNLAVYPNPATSLLNVKITNSLESVNLKVYNALGRIIDEFDTMEAELQIDISRFNNGLYYIGIDNGRQNKLEKFIKN